MAELLDKITADLNQALKDRDEVKVSTLRFLIAALKNAQIEKGGELTDEEVVSQIGKDAKRHKESITAYKGASRDELASKEEAELVILESYLPAAVGVVEIEKVVAEVISGTGASGPADMGKVMSGVMAKLKESGGMVDGGEVSEIVKAKLGGTSKI